MKAPVIGRAPLAAIDLMRNMAEAGWDPKIGYCADGSFEYWQVVGTWGDVRLEGWWRRSCVAPRQGMQWRPLILAKLRSEGHDIDDFRALEPQDDTDELVPGVMSQIHAIASVLSPPRFVEQILNKAPVKV
jgi:hypothetical protein